MSAPIIWDAGTANLDWYEIFSGYGIDVPEQPRRHGPCPVCGGKDRFRMDNRNGSGSWYCNQGVLHPSRSRAGDGFGLLEDFFDISRGEAEKKVLGGGRIDKRIRPNFRPAQEDSHQRQKITRILKESSRLADIGPDGRLTLQAGRKAVENYLASRGLPMLLPPEARILPEGADYSLVIPLTGDGDHPAVHVTALTRTGQKRSLPWTGGSARYTLGHLSGSYSSIPGSEEQISVPSFPGIRFYSIGEGLETILTGRLLSGWSSIFAINSNGLKTFFDNLETVRIFRGGGLGLAILVDKDISETGPKASAALARKAQILGIPTLYLLPPSIIKAGTKSADWNDALVELGKEGAKAALLLAISKSEEELSKIGSGKIVSLDNIRDSEKASVPVERIPVEQAFLDTRSLIKNFLDTKQTAPRLNQIDMGVGKSHILADLSRDHFFIGDPVTVIAPTKALAQEAALKSGGLFREGRTDSADRAGYCFIYPEVEPFSDKMRSIVAHKCRDCAHGLAAMAVSRGEGTKIEPCSYILHTIEAREVRVLSTTSSMLEGDPHIGTVREGKAVIKSKMILDDTADLTDYRAIHGGHISGWIRAANHAMRYDQAKLAEGDIATAEGEDRKERIVATEELLPHLAALGRFISDHSGDDQERVHPEDWTKFSELLKSSKIIWMDGSSAEAIYRDSEGKTEIPLRTLKALGEALARGTAWSRKSFLHFSSSTRAAAAIKNGAMLLDATPSLAVRQVVEAEGGTVTEIRAEQLSLCIRQVVSGMHGKTACSPESPSFAREKSRLLGIVEKAVEEHGPENVVVISHKALAEEVKDEIPAGVEIGWWGLHNRGQNIWEKKTHLVVYGVPQLAPSAAERAYMSDRQAVIEAGGTDWPAWNGSRSEKWYRVPGQAKEIHAKGYQDEFIDRWAREWTTAEVVQATGRLRAVRRTDERLSVEIHSSFPLAEAFGLEIHEVGRPDWRTMQNYQDGRKIAQIEKGVIAFRASGGGGRRTVEKWLEQHGMTGISPNDWAQVKEMADGIRQEYSLFPSNTTTEILGKDVHLLIEALIRLSSYAATERITLGELVEVGLVDPDCRERIALAVLRVARLPAASVAGPRPRFRTAPAR